MKFKVTIIIPCSEQHRSIRKSVRSLILQSAFTEFEILIMYNKPFVRDREFVEKIATKYHNVKIVESHTSELSSLRNHGFSLAAAPYVIFLNPGDEVIDDGYSLLANKAHCLGSDLLIASGKIIESSGSVALTDRIGSFTYENLANDKVRKSLLATRTFGGRAIYSASFLRANSIVFPEEHTLKAETIFEVACVVAAQKISKISIAVCSYYEQKLGVRSTKHELGIFEQASDTLSVLDKLYSSAFSESVTINQIVNIVNDDYLSRLVFLGDYDDLATACEAIYLACKNIGYDRLMRNLLLRKQIKLVESIEKKEYFYLVFLSSQLRSQVERSIRAERAKVNKSQARELRNLQSKYKKLRKRKLVKASLALSTLFSQRLLTQTSKPNAVEQHDDMLNQLLSIDPCDNSYWLFQDRLNKAQDNAEAMYRYVMENEVYDKTAFVLEEESSCYKRLEAEGFNLIPAHTIEHWKLLRNCKYLITSHCDYFARYPWIVGQEDKFEVNAKVNPLYKLIFLQHGVIRSDLSDWLGKNDFHKFVTSSRYERDSLLTIPQYKLGEEEVILTGQARFDYLRDTSTENVITVFPTWRREMRRAARRSLDRRREWFSKSPYCNSWIGLLKREELFQLASQNELKIRLVMHYNVSPFANLFKEVLPDAIEVIPYDEVESFAEIVNSSKVLITDKSSFSFDFLYLDKPAIYYDFDKDAQKENLVFADYSRLGYYCQNEDEVMVNIAHIARNDFVLEEDKAESIDDFFAFRDRDNSRRIVEEILRSER